MKRYLNIFMALLAIFLCQVSRGQKYVTTNADKAIALKIMTSMKEALDEAAADGTQLGVGDLMVMAAESMIGTGYVAGTLDEDPLKEELRIYLTKTDCIVFVETCLALARAVKEGGGDIPSFDDFASRVASTRYRTKAPYSYGDRIHYTTEWIRHQGNRLEDLTMELGGEVYDHPINFMSSNRKSYKQIADADNIPRAALALRKIEEAEEALNKEPMTCIPKSGIAQVVKGIRSGDIICFVSNVKGLDISHVAIAYLHDGKVGFIHASQKDGKVEIDDRTIEEYVRPRSNLSGIKVVRPL